MIEFILKIIIIIWPFGQLLRYTFLGQNIYLLDIALIFLTFSLFLNSGSRSKIFTNHISKYLLAFLAAASLSLVVNSIYLSILEDIKATFYLVRLFVYPSVYYALILVDWKRIKSSVIASILIFLILGLLQYLIFPDATSLKYIGFDDHYYRLIGTTFDPNYTGLILSMISLYFLSKSKYLYSFVIIPLIALTFSRATFIIYALSAFMVSIRKNIKISISVILILVAMIALSPKPFGEGVNLLRTFSILSRIDSWQTGLTLFIQRPIFGWGYNTLTNINGQRIGIDNSFIYIMATTGIIGITTFILLLLKVLKSRMKLEYLICLIAIILHSLFNNSFFFIWIFSGFWFVYGLSQKAID
jgi:O-antigen ligase